ncbi:hypothetical protein BC941DRAFT_408484 [Chlamydoabsidia padenii]|nr:hypothetical protein BC941DRAFT_408484 [Chlamydoabsidia padenii]
MLASLPCDYPRSKKRSRGTETDAFHWTKRTKHHNHHPPLLPSPPMIPYPDKVIPPPSPDTYNSSTQEPIDELMTDVSARTLFSERIDDLETYLNEPGYDDKERSDYAIYRLLQQYERPLKATLINGVLLPMEEKEGKYSIPDFVLRSWQVNQKCLSTCTDCLFFIVYSKSPISSPTTMNQPQQVICSHQ